MNYVLNIQQMFSEYFTTQTRTLGSKFTSSLHLFIFNLFFTISHMTVRHEGDDAEHQPLTLVLLLSWAANLKPAFSTSLQQSIPPALLWLSPVPGIKEVKQRKHIAPSSSKLNWGGCHAYHLPFPNPFSVFQLASVASGAYSQLRFCFPAIAVPGWDSLASIIHALLISHYCNVFHMELPLRMDWRLQLLQNVVARLISGPFGWDHVSPIWKALHFLVLVYKALNDLGPKYFQPYNRQGRPC